MTRRSKPLALLAILFGLLPHVGCTVCEYAGLTSHYEPKIFSRKRDKKASLATYGALADEAWATSGSQCPEHCTPSDFQWGFREGFSDYVYAGGSGEPPALPPRVYWQVDNRTAAGAAAVRSWFEGYRYGAEVAKGGGYRKTAVIAVSASVRDSGPCGCGTGPCAGACSVTAAVTTPNTVVPGSGTREPQPASPQVEDVTPAIELPTPPAPLLDASQTPVFPKRPPIAKRGAGQRETGEPAVAARVQTKRPGLTASAPTIPVIKKPAPVRPALSQPDLARPTVSSTVPYPAAKQNASKTAAKPAAAKAAGPVRLNDSQAKRLQKLMSTKQALELAPGAGSPRAAPTVVEPEPILTPGPALITPLAPQPRLATNKPASPPRVAAAPAGAGGPKPIAKPKRNVRQRDFPFVR